MKTFALSLFLCTACLADPSPTHGKRNVRGWQACDVSGKSVPVTQDVGDIATVGLPSPKAKVGLVSLLTTPATVPLTDKTITATIAITISPGAVYSVSSSAGWSIPPNVRIYFTTVPGPYNLSDANKNDTHYWWSDTAFIHLTEDVVNGLAVPMTATFTAPLDPSEWSDANGHRATESPAYTAAFNAAASVPAQLGFSFGSGNFFDTGVGAWSGTITFHVISYAAN
jgi:hypothetical protein